MAIEWLDNGCKTKSGFWRTGENKLLKISSMPINHLRKCIDFIWCYGGSLREFELDKLDELEAEIDKRDNKWIEDNDKK